MKAHTRTAGFFAFVWRLILTTGTGAIFGFLVARSGYDMALLAPMFVIMSFSFGLAIFILVLMATYNWSERPLGDVVLNRLRNLLGVFVAAVLYFVIVYHLTNLYETEHHGFESFMLLGDHGGEVYSGIFWIGQILLGSLLPLALIYAPKFKNSRKTLVAICLLVILGGLAQMYTIIIGGQAYPLEMFPGKEVLESGFNDGMTAHYAPSLPEILLGLGGVAVAFALVTVGIKALAIVPESLSDDVADPHHKAD